MLRTDFLFKHLKPGRILDIGDLGMAAQIHQQLFDRYPQSEIYGLDLEEQVVYQLNFPNQIVGNAEAMPFQDNYFDTVYLGEVLEHTWQPKLMLSECYRILKPGGVIILDTPNVYALARMLRYIVKGNDIILGNADHKIFYSRAMLDNLFKKVGFVVLETSSDSKCTIKSKTILLPRIGALKYLGEHLLGAAKKPEKS